MIDVKSAASYSTGFPASVFICQPPRPEPYTSQELYNPVYEELSNGSGDRGESDPESEGAAPAPASEDEFAEDELSLGGECDPAAGRAPEAVTSATSSLQGSRDLDSSDADDRSRNPGGRNLSLPPGYRSNSTSRSSRALHAQAHPHRSTTTEQRRPRSLDRRRGWRVKGPQVPPAAQSPRHQDCGEFHEGLLLDALLQLYPSVGTARQGRNAGGGVPSVAHRLPYLMPQVPAPAPAPALREQRSRMVNPYESVPVLNHLHQHHHGGGYGPQRAELFSTFRPAPSQDSSFGSDSGYSNNTSGGGGRVPSRGRKGGHRLSAHSGDLVMS